MAFAGYQPLQLPTAVAGTLFKDVEIREGKKGYFATGKLKVAGGGFVGFISFDELATETLGQCKAGTAVYLQGFVKAGRPYPNKQSGEMMGTLDLTVESAVLIEHEGWRGVRNEKGSQQSALHQRTAPPRAAAPRDDHGDANGNVRDGFETSTEGGDGQKDFDDEIPF